LDYTQPVPLIGVSFGRRWERTGIAIIERVHVPTGEKYVEARGGWPSFVEKLRVEYHVRYLDRYGPMPRYSTVNQAVVEMVRELQSDVFLMTDVTGVGTPLWQRLRGHLRAELNGGFKRVKPGIFQVSGLQGGVAQGADKVISVPRRDLVTNMQLLLEEERIKVSGGLDLASTLQKELLDFKIKAAASGREDLESWREGAHDDLVLAVALPAWAGERYMKRKETIPADGF
jgi:hypothetical protein